MRSIFIVWFAPAQRFHESQFLEGVDVFEGGGSVIGPDLGRHPAEFHESSARAENIPAGTPTGSVLASFDLTG